MRASLIVTMQILSARRGGRGAAAAAARRATKLAAARDREARSQLGLALRGPRPKSKAEAGWLSQRGQRGRAAQVESCSKSWLLT